MYDVLLYYWEKDINIRPFMVIASRGELGEVNLEALTWVMACSLCLKSSIYEVLYVSKSHTHTQLCVLHLTLEKIYVCKRNVLNIFLIRFYCQDIRAYDILFGDIPRPAEAEDLYEILDSFTEKYENEGQRINARKAARERKKASVIMLGFYIFLSSHRKFLYIEHSILDITFLITYYTSLLISLT